MLLLRSVKLNKFISTFFYIGFLRPAPGTWGSIAGIILAFILLITLYDDLEGNFLLTNEVDWFKYRIDDFLIEELLFIHSLNSGNLIDVDISGPSFTVVKEALSPNSSLSFTNSFIIIFWR